MNSAAPALTKDDFASDQEVRWCPGCGDYSILAAVQKVLPSLGIARENVVFISGIGCSSRFPYYMNTYGFHTIHGRAPGIATGVKLANPDLSVWVVTGDGDALSIGGNHFIHLLRRNVDLTVLLFNNRIYGLTKGQYSPTSKIGTVTKSTPGGSLDYPLNPLALALGAQATFVARAVERDQAQLTEVLKEAHQHKGTSLVEIYQNCNIFNDGAFDYVAERANRAEAQLVLKHGELLTFGKERSKGISFHGYTPKVVTFDPTCAGSAEQAGVIRFDRHDRNLAHLIAQLEYPEFPVPMGVLFQGARETFDNQVAEQRRDSCAKQSIGGSTDEVLSQLFRSGETWEVRR